MSYNTAPIMTQRGHPFNQSTQSTQSTISNQSTRPLLAERKPPQLLLNKKKFNHNTDNYHHHSQSPSPILNKQNNGTNNKVHGFNDFDIISQQYRNLNNHHIGYPYGSPPPSPTANSNDFVFSDTNQNPKLATTNVTKASNNFYNNTSTPKAYNNAPQKPPLIPSHTNMIHGHINEINNYDDCNNYCATHYGDDFSWRRAQPNFIQSDNVKPSLLHHNNELSNSNNDGPFVFGVHHQIHQNLQNHHQNSQMTTNGGGIIENNKSTTVINNNSNAKYSLKTSSNNNNNNNNNNNHHNKSMSASNTSSSSRDSDKDSNFLVKNRKSSKKNSKDKKNNKENYPKIKCVVVGDGAVGKTNLIVSYLENRFIWEHVPTASDIYNAQVMVNDNPVHVTLCDTAGQDTLDPLRVLCYPDSDVFLLSFSVVKPETFQSIKTKWAPKFFKTKAVLILVGTQSDLRSDINVLNRLQIQGEKPVSFSDAWDLATSIGAKYIETSSFTQDKVKDVFDTAIWEALIPKTLPPTPPLWKKLLCLV